MVAATGHSNEALAVPCLVPFRPSQHEEDRALYEQHLASTAHAGNVALGYPLFKAFWEDAAHELDEPDINAPRATLEGKSGFQPARMIVHKQHLRAFADAWTAQNPWCVIVKYRNASSPGRLMGHLQKLRSAFGGKAKDTATVVKPQELMFAATDGFVEKLRTWDEQRSRLQRYPPEHPEMLHVEAHEYCIPLPASATRVAKKNRRHRPLPPVQVLRSQWDAFLLAHGMDKPSDRPVSPTPSATKLQSQQQQLAAAAAARGSVSSASSPPSPGSDSRAAPATSPRSAAGGPPRAPSVASSASHGSPSYLSSSKRISHPAAGGFQTPAAPAAAPLVSTKGAFMQPAVSWPDLPDADLSQVSQNSLRSFKKRQANAPSSPRAAAAQSQRMSLSGSPRKSSFVAAPLPQFDTTSSMGSPASPQVPATPHQTFGAGSASDVAASENASWQWPPQAVVSPCTTFSAEEATGSDGTARSSQSAAMTAATALSRSTQGSMDDCTRMPMVLPEVLKRRGTAAASPASPTRSPPSLNAARRVSHVWRGGGESPPIGFPAAAAAADGGNSPTSALDAYHMRHKRASLATVAMREARAGEGSPRGRVLSDAGMVSKA